MIVRKDNAVYFDEGPGSNFHPAPTSLFVVYADEEIKLPTSEHHYQLGKACLADDIEYFHNICDAESPTQAKRLGRNVPMSPDERQAWDDHIALETMVECCVAKFRQNFECWLWLQGTGDDRLVEHRRDKIWGDGLDGSGKNLLGKTLELVRALIRS